MGKRFIVLSFIHQQIASARNIENISIFSQQDLPIIS